jgi:hypothetical protein
VSPHRYAHKYYHVDDCREAYRKGRQEQALMWMAKNHEEDFGIETIAQTGYDGEENKNADVEDEEDDGYDLEPVTVVRELMEQNRHDACAHRDYEPSVANRSPSQRLAVSRALMN